MKENCKDCSDDLFHNLKVLSRDDTLNDIIYKSKSISRFGDGELKLIFGNGIKFQKYNDRLSKRLESILKSNNEGILIGISGMIKNTHRSKFWDKLIKKYKYNLLNILDFNKIYGNTGITRFYLAYAKNRTYLNNIPKYINKLKMIWNEKDIVIIEGDKSRLGVGNDLFNNSKSIQRILGPAENAFDLYDKIYNEALKISKDKLILIALGPTATVLAYDLHNAGYQAIDIGHVDIEYEWYLRNATEKVKIENKYVNELKFGDVDINDVTDENYYKQIIVKI